MNSNYAKRVKNTGDVVDLYTKNNSNILSMHFNMNAEKRRKGQISCGLTYKLSYGMKYAGTVLVIIKLTNFAVAVWFRCGCSKLTFCLYFIILCDV